MTQPSPTLARNSACRRARRIVGAVWLVVVLAPARALPADDLESGLIEPLVTAEPVVEVSESIGRFTAEVPRRSPREPINPVSTLFQWNVRSASGDDGAADYEFPPLASDRPDFTEASSTVGRGVLQAELGYTFIDDDDGPAYARAHSYPELLLRHGVLAGWLELRLGQNIVSTNDGFESITGADDLYLGVKLGLTQQAGIWPEMAIVPQMRVPTGHRDVTADEVLPGLNWLYGWDIGEFVSTAGSSQFNRAIDDATDEAFTLWAQSWTFGFSLTDRWGSYTEWFGLFPHSAESFRPQHYFDGGFTFAVTDDLQWDIRAGVGLNEAADDFFIGSGLVVRFH